MNENKYTVDSAFKKVMRNADVRTSKTGIFLVRNGSAGNGTLGAISFLNKHSDYLFQIVTNNKI